MGKNNCLIIIDGPVAYVPLTLGLVAIIDAEDVGIVASYVWHAFKHGRTYYARTNVKRADSSGYTSIRLHRLILTAPEGINVDHRDGDGLNNRKRGDDGNLRLASQNQNAMNRRLAKNNTSGHSGVCWKKSSGKWSAQIGGKGSRRNLGCFDTKQAAIDARRVVSAKIFGEFDPAHQMKTVGGLFRAGK